MTRRFPAEWERHEATLLTWPWDAGIWGAHHEGAVQAIARAAAALSHGERVVIHVPSESVAHRARAAVEEHAPDPRRVEFTLVDSDDVWVRDHGPTFVVERTGLVAVDWNFNAWGGKFPHDADARVALAAAANAGAAHERAGIVLEGGALECDGAGTVLCTRSVALTPTRNPGVDEATIDAEIRRRTGATRVVWLDSGMACDDTDGHVDTLARFAPTGSMLVHVMADPAHPDADALVANLEVLRGALGAALAGSVEPLPAATCVDADGELLPASYANFYVGNAVVLVPQYGLDTDDAALAIVGRHHPGREVLGLDCLALVSQGGAIHCATQQVPARG